MRDISLSNTVPRTYENVQDLLDTLNVRKGAPVNLTFEGESFTFFLTR